MAHGDFHLLQHTVQFVSISDMNGIPILDFSFHYWFAADKRSSGVGRGQYLDQGCSRAATCMCSK